MKHKKPVAACKMQAKCKATNKGIPYLIQKESKGRPTKNCKNNWRKVNFKLKQIKKFELFYF
jgi:hypothetical protein